MKLKLLLIAIEYKSEQRESRFVCQTFPQNCVKSKTTVPFQAELLIKYLLFSPKSSLQLLPQSKQILLHSMTITW